MLSVLLIFIDALIISSIAIPRIIFLARTKKLFDDPNEMRKVHQHNIPNLGGAAIFMSVVLTQTLFINQVHIPNNHLIFSAIVLFMIGLKDDLVGISPYKKFFVQFLVAIILTFVGNVRFTNLGHLLSFTEMNYASSLLISIFFIVGLINAYNLIDGIDGLAGTQALVFSASFALLFYFAGEREWMLLSVAICGAIIGFLRYNLSPAQIFMGDSGAFLIGLYAAVLSIAFVDVAMEKPFYMGEILVQSPYGIVAALLMIPVFDTLRLITLRMIKNGSPFKADRNHLHHRLLDLGLNHTQSSIILALLTLLFLAIALFFQNMGNTVVVLGLFSVMICINMLIFQLNRKLNARPYLTE